MPKGKSSRQRHLKREQGSPSVAISSSAARPTRRRAKQPSWFSRNRPSLITYGVIGAIVLGVVGLMFTSVQDTLANDFEFSMYQGNVGATAQDAHFSDLFPSDKPVVLNFWAGLCPPCRAEMPGFQRVYDQYENRIALLGLDIGTYMGLGSNRDARRLLSELNITYPTGYSHSRDPVIQFGVTAMPTTVFFTPDGKVFSTDVGYLDEGQLEGKIQRLLTASAPSS